MNNEELNDLARGAVLRHKETDHLVVVNDFDEVTGVPFVAQELTPLPGGYDDWDVLVAGCDTGLPEEKDNLLNTETWLPPKQKKKKHHRKAGKAIDGAQVIEALKRHEELIIAQHAATAHSMNHLLRHIQIPTLVGKPECEDCQRKRRAERARKETSDDHD